MQEYYNIINPVNNKINNASLRFYGMPMRSIDVICDANSSVCVCIKHANFGRKVGIGDSRLFPRSLVPKRYKISASFFVLAIAFRTNDPMLSSMKLGYPLLQTRTMQLYHNSGVDLSQGGSYQHIQSFQNHLASYTIVVYNSRIGDSVYFEGPREPGRVVLNLILEDEHYNVITSLTSAFTCSYYCDKRIIMKCQYQCPCCHEKPPCSIQNAKIVCKDCNRDFHGQECFQNHKDTDLCKKLRRCLKCLKTFEVKGKHRCGYSRCPTCKNEKPIGHHCYMAVNKAPRDTAEGKTSMFIFYDLECMQEKIAREQMIDFSMSPIYAWP
ncbi:hypothetical protein RI129_000027 [Pyrocoelia pectoralis]|uniref:Uncharacterized protein n=1 Tax=Pyrocoelia pectoralis TaxID=417401 RepID=A0AAN7ZED3_9COLE